MSENYAVSRRSFVKMGAAALGATAAGGIGATGLAKSAEAKTFAETDGIWKKNHCGCCSYQNCGLEVHVVDGVAVEIRGNKEHPANKGALCPRSSSALATLYNPYRVKGPLKRTNPEKGNDVDPKWMEISWDEAYELAYEKFSSAILDDPETFAFQYGFSGSSLERNIIKATTMIVGSSNFFFSCGPLCEIHYSAFRFGGNHLDKPDLGHCRYIVDFGRSIGGSVMFASGPARCLSEAIDDGLKVVVVNPHQTPEASKGEWIPIKPSTDIAFMMAMVNVMFYELDAYDREACRERTNSPYLIDSEGLYVRSENNKALVWDITTESAKEFDDETLGEAALEGEFEVNGIKVTTAFAALKASVKDATPEWAEAKTTVPAETIRRVTREFIEAAKIGATIDIDGVTMPYRPACVLTGRGTANAAQGRRSYWLANVINTLIGSTGVPGGIQASTDKAYYVDNDGMFEPTGMITSPDEVNITLPTPSYSMLQYFPLAVFPSVFSMATEAVIDPEGHHMAHKLAVQYFYGTNGIQAETAPEKHAEAYRQVPFVFMHALTLDEMSSFCDLVMADTCHLERLHFSTIGDILAGDEESFQINGGTNFSYPAVDPVYDCRMPEEMFVDFYHKMGPRYNATLNTIFGVLAGNPALLDPTKEYSFEELMAAAANFLAPTDNGEEYFKEHGFYVNKKSPAECYDYNELWLEKKSRYHVYDHPKLAIGKKLKSEYERNGIEMPGWEGNMDMVYAEYIPTPKWIDNFITEDNDEFDLLACNWKVSCRNLGEALADSNPWLREVIEDWTIDDFAMQINPVTAEAKGIETGDTVRVTSQHGGVVEGTIKVTNLIHPDAVGFPHNGGGRSMHASPLTRKGVNYNTLLTNDPGYYIPDSGMVYNTARIKIEKIS